MAKNHKKLKCIHCLNVPEEITEDHVIPNSWYSAVHSKDVFKPRAPSCFKCNNELGEKEKVLSHTMWMCMPEDHPLRPELAMRAYRAWGMTPDGKALPGLNEKERHARMQYLRKTMSGTVPASQLDERRMLPGFNFHAGYPKESQRATIFDYQALLAVASKVVRGIEYIQQGRNRYIEKPYKLEVYFPRDPDDSGLMAIRNICKTFFDGTNLIQRGANPDRPLEPIYIIKIWNLWEIWGVILHEDREEELAKSMPSRGSNVG